MSRAALKILSIIVFTFISQPAHAGWMDKLNQATQKVNQASQQIKANKPVSNSQAAEEDPDRPLHLDESKSSCEGKRSATCMDYMETANRCLDPLNGYRAKLLGDRIEKNLKEDSSLNKRKRQKLEELLVATREAEKNKAEAPNGYLNDISEEDQVCINADYNSFYKKIYSKCVGADHMGIGKRTEMMEGTETLTCEQAVAALRETRKKENAPMECMQGVAGLRYTVMAEHMEKKMAKLNLSDKERLEWESDIAAVRKVAAENGKTMPQSDDPANPMRPLMRLNAPDDAMAVNNEFIVRQQALMTECQNMGSGSGSARGSKGTGLVDHSQSPANKNAKKHVEKKYADLNYGRGGSTNLLALRRDKGCDRELRGNIPRLTAELLEEKLKSAKNLTDDKRREWEEDIAAFRAAADAGVDSPEPPDPDNAYRWYDYVTKEERAAVNKKHADQAAKVMKECNSKPSGL